jgi:hypothetical protein
MHNGRPLLDVTPEAQYMCISCQDVLEDMQDVEYNGPLYCECATCQLNQLEQVLDYQCTAPGCRVHFILGFSASGVMESRPRPMTRRSRTAMAAENNEDGADEAE